MVNNDKKSMAERLKKLEGYADSYGIFADIYNRIGELEQKLAPENFDKMVKSSLQRDFDEFQKQKQSGMDNLIKSVIKPPPQIKHPGSCYENGCDRFGWISPETHADVIKKKDQRIRAQEERINALVDDMKRNRIMISQFKKLMNDTTL